MDFLWIVALVCTGIIVCQLGLSFLGIIDDLDFDADGDVDFDSSIILSPKGILHFLAGSSWYLIIARYTNGGEIRWFDWLIAIGVGLIIAGLIFLIYYGMSKLDHTVTPETDNDLVNKTAEIYSRIGKGEYTVLIEVNGSLSTKTVASKSDKQYNPGEKTQVIEFSAGKLWIE